MSVELQHTEFAYDGFGVGIGKAWSWEHSWVPVAGLYDNILPTSTPYVIRERIMKGNEKRKEEELAEMGKRGAEKGKMLKERECKK